MSALLLTILFLLIPAMAHAETISLYAAGSLRGALTDVGKAYEANTEQQGGGQVRPFRHAQG